jgi:N-formylglutamate amidohydrolase
MTAIHAGHDLRPAVQANIALDDATRLREEDPYTDRLTAAAGTSVVVHRSRFEVDLNRPRDGAVYSTPDTAWGLHVWRDPLPEEERAESLALYDRFHAELALELDRLAAAGPFLLLDLHSYNHRREGPDAAPADRAGNPEINIGTGSLDRDRWGLIVERCIEELGACEVDGHHLDVRENVRFRGGHLTEWVHERYDGTGCALAVEVKKTFMDEWTGQPDEVHLAALTRAFASTSPLLLGELACGVR